MPGVRLIALAAVLALAQGAVPPGPQQPPPRFRGGTNLVRVDVYATTRGGVAVQDLTAADFELSEDEAVQKIDSFEHIVVRAGGPQEERSEPASVTAANALAADPRRRVFVLYLDIEHVSLKGSLEIKEPLIDLMTRMMGPDDLVGVMTPTMSPSQITFGRRTKVIEDGLRTNWPWGRRDTIVPDEREALYRACFPRASTDDTDPSRLAVAMTKRRRERMVLDSLHGLVRHMAAIRDGRTAVITVSEGWLLYGEDRSLMVQRKNDDGDYVDPMPGPPPIGVGPGGALTKRINTGGVGPSDRTQCDKERMALAMLDNPWYFREIFGEANRANVSFYPIDPRGLPVFDTPVGPERLLSPEADLALLERRTETLHTLAINTDGLALVNSIDLTKQIRRMADDLTSYYLLGYYSTNGKLDGKFRSIKVRSKRPGVEIRARQGYKAATAEDVARARTAAETVIPEARAAVARALGTIEGDARAAGRKTTRVAGDPVVLHRGPSTGNQMQPADGRVFPRSERLRLELEAAAGTPVWTGVLLDRNGTRTAIPVAAGERTDAATGQRWLTADITLAPLGPGDYVVELTTVNGSETRKSLVAIRVTR